MRNQAKLLLLEHDAEIDTKMTIYREALPHYLDRVDCCTMDRRGEVFAYQWLEQLLQRGQLSLQVQAAPTAADKLHHLYFESHNLERNHGARMLGFGYPLFLQNEDDDLTAAPLFIWPLQIEPSPNLDDDWTIRFIPEATVEPNYFLLEKLQEQTGKDWASEAKKLLEKGKLNPQSLADWCAQLASELEMILPSQFILFYRTGLPISPGQTAPAKPTC